MQGGQQQLDLQNQTVGKLATFSRDASKSSSNTQLERRPHWVDSSNMNITNVKSRKETRKSRDTSKSRGAKNNIVTSMQQGRQQQQRCQKQYERQHNT